MSSTCSHPGCGSPYADFICETCKKPVCFRHHVFSSKYKARFCSTCWEAMPENIQTAKIQFSKALDKLDQLDMFGGMA